MASMVWRHLVNQLKRPHKATLIFTFDFFKQLQINWINSCKAAWSTSPEQILREKESKLWNISRRRLIPNTQKQLFLTISQHVPWSSDTITNISSKSCVFLMPPCSSRYDCDKKHNFRICTEVINSSTMRRRVSRTFPFIRNLFSFFFICDVPDWSKTTHFTCQTEQYLYILYWAPSPSSEAGLPAGAVWTSLLLICQYPTIKWQKWFGWTWQMFSSWLRDLESSGFTHVAFGTDVSAVQPHMDALWSCKNEKEHIDRYLKCTETLHLSWHGCLAVSLHPYYHHNWPRKDQIVGDERLFEVTGLR